MRINYDNYTMPANYEAKEVFIRQYNFETDQFGSIDPEMHSSSFRIGISTDDALVCQWTVRPKQPMYPQSFLNGLQALRNAWIDIVQAIDDYNDIELGAVMAKNYPFDESFDDMFPAVKAWTEGMLPQEMK